LDFPGSQDNLSSWVFDGLTRTNVKYTIMMKWLAENKEWVFSGCGVALIAAILGCIFKSRKRREQLNQRQTGGDRSTNLQAGGNISIGGKEPRTPDPK
jgi:hypothetical protein